jgi:hypothetical protein
MQAANFRYIILITALAAGAVIYAVFGEPNGNTGTPRLPAAEALYAADQWSTGPLAVEHNTDAGRKTDLATRTFRNRAGATATLTIVTSQAPKLYGAGAEVPFLGSGYTVLPAPGEVVSVDDQPGSALVAQRGAEQWLVMYAYGERRGLLGNGPLPWTLAMLDGIAGQPNDYYKLYLAARTDQLDPGALHDVAGLARVLFPRIAAWYAA